MVTRREFYAWLDRLSAEKAAEEIAEVKAAEESAEVKAAEDELLRRVPDDRLIAELRRRGYQPHSRTQRRVIKPHI